jgi:hypothetical protein
MSRTIRLQFCRQCKKRAFSSKSGIVCSLTNEQANFQDRCEYFEKDDSVQMQQSNERSQKIKLYNKQKLDTYFQAFLITLYFSIAIIIATIIFLIEGGSPVGLIIGGLVNISATIIQVILIYNIWDYIITEYKLQGEQPPIESPGKAVGYLFIPFYNFYWIFIVYGKLMESLNKLAESRNKELFLPVNLGTIICIFSLTSIIPIVGTLLALIAMLVLIPVFFSKTIRAIKEIPHLQDNTTKRISMHDHNRVNLSNIRNYSELFNTSIRGFNFKLVFIYLIGVVLNYTLINLINSQFRNVFFNAYFLTELLFQSFFIFLFIYLSGVLKNIILVLSTGVLILIKNVCTFYVYYLLMSKNNGDLNIDDFFRIPYLAGYFLYGILYVTGLLIVVRIFGARFWSLLIYGFSLFYITTAIWLGISFLDEGYNFEYSWTNLLVVPVIRSFIIASSFYLGFLWYFNSSGKDVYNRNRIDMLDSGL